MEASTNSKTAGRVERPPIRRLKLRVTKVLQSQSVLGVMGDRRATISLYGLLACSPSLLFQPHSL